jgi:hypothetical protein
MLTARISVAKFVSIIGRSEINMPYVSQSRTPVQKIRYIPSDKSLADFVFHVFMTCGKKAIVVQNPAASPIIICKFISAVVIGLICKVDCG